MASVPATAPERPAALVGRRREPPDEVALFTRRRQAADPRSRDELVERFLPLARHLARRYDATGRSFDDLYQVACLALVNAVDRYDPSRGVPFSSYAVPTVIGEIKHYFRDQTWAVHLPRDLQERSLRVRHLVADVGCRLGRRPTVAEIADAAGWSPEDVLEAMAAASAYRTTSLEAPKAANAEDAVTLGETIGYEDERFSRIEQRADLAALVDRLPLQERTALTLRFQRELTQTEIADVLGVSQIEVARSLRRALERLRALEALNRTAAAAPERQ